MIERIKFESVVAVPLWYSKETLITEIMSIYQHSIRRIEQGIFGFVAAGVLAQSCLGSIASMLILQNGISLPQMFQLFIAVAVTMTFNGAVLSNQKANVLLPLLIISAIVNSILAIINLLTFIY